MEINGYKVRPRVLFVPIERCLINGVTQFVITYCFFYTFKSNVNSGIIASIFSSSVVFTAVMFYCFFGQKLSKFDILGCSMIIGCVCMIALGENKSSETNDLDHKYLTISLLLALVTGFMFSVNAFDLFHCINVLKYPVA